MFNHVNFPSLTYFVFLIILVAFFVFPLFSKSKATNGCYGKKYKYPLLLDWTIVVPCLIYAFLFGFRYNFGYDWDQYFYTFQYIQNGTLFRDTTEIGYLLINRFIGFCGGNIYTLFIFEGFMWVISLCLLFKNDRKKLHIIIPLFIMITWFRVLNLSRQHFAMSFFFIALSMLLDGKTKRYLFWSIIAASIHSSVLLFAVPFFLLYRSNISVPSLKKILSCYGLIVIAKSALTNVLLSLGTFFTVYLITNKDYSMSALLSDKFQWETSVSKMMMWIFIDVVSIIGIRRLISQIKINKIGKKYVPEYYMLCLGLIGAILRPLGECHEIFSRTFFYFTYFEYLGFAMWICYLMKNFKSKEIPLWLKMASVVALCYVFYSFIFGLQYHVEIGNYIEYIVGEDTFYNP